MRHDLLFTVKRLDKGSFFLMVDPNPTPVLAPTQLPYARLPILIGFTGKGNFPSGDNSLGYDPIAAFRRRWCTAIEWLDDRFPLTPKVLMCGGDVGADFEAVSEVLRADGEGAAHPLWSVVLVKAFDEFTAREDEIQRRYDEFLAGNSRMQQITLRHLLKDAFDDNRPDGALGLPELLPGDEISEAGKAARTRFRGYHFDQLGFWLARYSTLLFAAAPAETADILEGARPGAVSRVIAFRRTAMVDRPALEMRERSLELLNGTPLEDPDAGHVFWIDMSPEAHDPPADLPFTILQPITRLFEQHGSGNVSRTDSTLEQQRSKIYANPYLILPAKVAEEALAHKPHEVESRALAAVIAFDRFHWHQLPSWKSRIAWEALNSRPARWLPLFRWRTRVAASARQRLLGASPAHAPFASPGEYRGGEPFDYLAIVRAGKPMSDPKAFKVDVPLDRQQQSHDRASTLSLRLLVGLVLAAVVCLEVFTELSHHAIGWLGLYVLLFLAVAGVAFVANRRRWTQIAEDLRGLKEVMRVQIAWWQAGIDRMVDRVHLRSIDSDLTMVREISATISMWALLRCSFLGPDQNATRIGDEMKPIWASLVGVPASTACSALYGHVQAQRVRIRSANESWIKAQANYYHGSWQEQRNYVRLAEHMASISLAAACAKLFCLLAIVWPEYGETIVEQIAIYFTEPDSRILAPLGGWWVIAGFLALSAVRHMTGSWDLKQAKMAPFGFYIGTAFALTGALGLIAVAVNLLSSLYTWSLSAIATMLGFYLVWQCLLPEKSKEWKVSKLPFILRLFYGLAAAACLLGFDLLLAPGLDQIWQLFGSKTNLNEALESLILVTTTLSLATTALGKYYVEHRNHRAQCSEYNNANRAFLRMANYVGAETQKIEINNEAFKKLFSAAAPAIIDEDVLREKAHELVISLKELRINLVDLGELALDENESWLQAHRERPIEAISTG